MPQASYKATVIPDDDRAHDFRGLDQLAWLMDRAIRIPGTKITVGLDALLGLLPVGGDVCTGIVQSAIVLFALYRYRVPRAVAARMAANVLLDTALGAIPVVGDVFDVFFKANTRNVALLRQLQNDRSRRRETTTWRSIAYLAVLGLALITLLVMLLVGFITMVTWLVHTFTSPPAH